MKADTTALAAAKKAAADNKAKLPGLTAAVNTALAKDLGFQLANRTKATTEDGTLYLMGFLTNTEIEQVTATAQSVGGVERIVALFERID